MSWLYLYFTSFFLPFFLFFFSFFSSLCSGQFRSFWHVYKVLWGHINKFAPPPTESEQVTISRRRRSCLTFYLVCRRLFFIIVFVKEINTASPTVVIVHLKVAAAPRLQPSDQSQQQPSDPISLSNSIFFSTETTPECIKKNTHILCQGFQQSVH